MSILDKSMSTPPFSMHRFPDRLLKDIVSELCCMHPIQIHVDKRMSPTGMKDPLAGMKDPLHLPIRIPLPSFLIPQHSRRNPAPYTTEHIRIRIGRPGTVTRRCSGGLVGSFAILARAACAAARAAARARNELQLLMKGELGPGPVHPLMHEDKRRHRLHGLHPSFAGQLHYGTDDLKRGEAHTVSCHGTG